MKSKRLNNIHSAICIAFLALLMIVSLGFFQDAHAEGKTIVSSGTWGTCTWDLDSEGVFTMHPGTGANTGSDSSISTPVFEDLNYEKVKQVIARPENDEYIVAPRICWYLFSGFTNATHFDLSGLDTSNTTNMSEMFANCQKVTTIDISNLNFSNVTKLQGLFSGCSSLTTINMDDLEAQDLQYINAICSNCTSLESVSIKGLDAPNLTTCNSLFSGCTSLENADISNWNVPKATYAWGIFNNCTNLKNIDISGWNAPKIQTVNSMFEGCSAIEEIDLSSWPIAPTNMNYMFRNCSSLKTLNISNIDSSNIKDGVTDFMRNCTSLSKVTVGSIYVPLLPSVEINGHTDWFSEKDWKWFTSSDINSKRRGIADTYNKIGVPEEQCGFNSTWELNDDGTLLIEGEGEIKIAPWNSANNQGKIKRVEISDGISSICESAFSGCTNLISISIPGSVIEVGKSAFQGCTSLTSVSFPGELTYIPENLFYGCTNLETVSIPGSITNVGGSAFRNCTSLTGVSFSGELTSIPDNLFYGCSSLEEVIIPNSVTIIGGSAFNGCTALTSINLPAELNSIGSWAFGHCTNLKKLILPEGTETIGEDAFYECTSLKSITIPNTVVTIGSGALGQCSSLTSIKLPNNIKAIASGLLAGCTKLEEVDLPNGVVSIGAVAFKECTGVDKIFIPGSVETIAGSSRSESPFLDASDQLKIYCEADSKPSGWASLWNNNKDAERYLSAYFGYSREAYEFFPNLDKQTASLTIPSTIETIPEEALNGFDRLESVTISDGITTIKRQAFANCVKLSDILLPSSVTTIESGAFYQCSSLNSIYIPISVRTIKAPSDCSNSPFYCCSENATLYCEAEDEQPNWGAYWNYVDNSKTLNVQYAVSTDEYMDTLNLCPLGHPWQDKYTTDKQATCDEDGSKSIHCTICDRVKEVETIPASGHRFGEWTCVKPSTCEESGSEKRVCEVCGFAETQATEPDGHTWNDDFTIDKEATCTEDGQKSIHCIKCEAVKDVEVIEAEGHAFSEWEEIGSRTCNEIGHSQRICGICGFTETKDLDPEEHLWDSEITVDVKATCDADGSQSIHCSKCDAKKDSEVIPSLGHNWVVNTKEPTCTTSGSWTTHCTRCGSIGDSKYIPAVGHDWSDPTYTWSKDNKTVTATRMCKNDSGHKESESVNTTSAVTKKATYTAKGQTTYTAVFKNSAFTKQTKTLTNIAQFPKKANTITVKVKKPTVSFAKLKKKAQTIAAKNAFAVSKAQGKVTYKKVSGNAKVAINSAGKITLKKGLKKGTYKVKVKVTAAGTTVYKAGAKTVTISIKVK